MVECRQELMSLSVEQRECFKKLDAFLQDLVVLFEHGRSSVMDLADRVNDHVDQVLERIEAKRREDELCTSFLSSLQFEDMTLRMDFIEPAHEDTFHWILISPGRNYAHGQFSQNGSKPVLVLTGLMEKLGQESPH